MDLGEGKEGRKGEGEEEGEGEGAEGDREIPTDCLLDEP